MNISLPPEQEEWVQKKAKSGRYQSVSEVVREGLRLLEREESRRITTEQIRNQIQVGIDEIQRGEGIPFEEAMTKLERKHAVTVAVEQRRRSKA